MGSSAWVGVYSDASFGSQFRAGADSTLQVAKYLQLQPSLQLASRGFVGGSFNVQVGAAWYGIVGLGRTDARPYFDLNFDPNDAMTYGVGHNEDSGASYSVFVVEDNRFRSGQRDWHANAQIPFGLSHATVDGLHKSGFGDAGYVNAWGGSINYKSPRWFARLAYDPYQNFSATEFVACRCGHPVPNRPVASRITAVAAEDASDRTSGTTIMAKAYWINFYLEIKDPDRLAAYAKLAGPALEAAGGRLCARRRRRRSSPATGTHGADRIRKCPAGTCGAPEPGVPGRSRGPR